LDEQDKKIKDMVDNYDKDKKKESEKDKKKKDNSIDNIEDKLKEMAKYTNEQKVKKDGYCYIGFENGQRECAEVYGGDVCMSGEIFTTLEKCMNPQLRD
jgi:hypothetical protein